MMPAVALLAGGRATRLGPLCEKIPKSMLPVAGAPFITHQLRLLARQGVRKVVILTGHLGNQIRDFVGDGAGFGLTVTYVEDGPVPLGTGGALRHALPLLGDEFLILYGDSYLPTSFAPIVASFRASIAVGQMTVFRNEGRWDRSNVLFEAGRIVAYDKHRPSLEMRHIDYGLGALRSAAFANYAGDDVFDLAHLYQALLLRGVLTGYEVTDRFYEIGSPAGLVETDHFLRNEP